MRNLTTSPLDTLDRLVSLLLLSLHESLPPKELAELTLILDTHPAYRSLYQQMSEPKTRHELLQSYQAIETDPASAYWQFLDSNAIQVRHRERHHAFPMRLIKFIRLLLAA